MKRMFTIALLASACSWLPSAAQAQAVYRCGDSYSQQPCPGGKAVQVDDARSAGQRSDTGLAAQRDAKSADAMEKARQKEEAKAAPVGMPPPKAAEGDDAAVKPIVMVKPKKPDQFTAVAPRKTGDTQAKNKKKSKAKRKNTVA